MKSFFADLMGVLSINDVSDIVSCVENGFPEISGFYAGSGGLGLTKMMYTCVVPSFFQFHVSVQNRGRVKLQ